MPGERFSRGLEGATSVSAAEGTSAGSAEAMEGVQSAMANTTVPFA